MRRQAPSAPDFRIYHDDMIRYPRARAHNRRVVLIRHPATIEIMISRLGLRENSDAHSLNKFELQMCTANVPF